MILNLTISVFGLFIGSFLACLVYRLENNQSFLRSRSFCPKCKHTLGVWDLAPVLSFVWLRGKCRYCRQEISWQHPLSELGTAVVFFLVSFFSSDYSSLVYYLIASSFLIIIFIYDLKHYLILDKVIYPAIALALAFNSRLLFSGQASLFFSFLLSALGAALFFILIILVSRGKWLGQGDVKLAIFMGLLLGWPGIALALFLANFLGAIIGIGLILARKKSLKSEVPFGPFLVVGTLIALFWGERIVNWYLNFLNL
jgi:prepilin signal peptidase PulO-like enzyme (type II secretory pathway)